MKINLSITNLIASLKINYTFMETSFREAPFVSAFCSLSKEHDV